MNPIPPPEVVAAAQLVGQWFAEQNVKTWAIGPCASRQPHDENADLAMMLRMCARSLSLAGKSDLANRAMDLLRRHDLAGSPMRTMDIIVATDPEDSDGTVFCTGVAENGTLHIVDFRREAAGVAPLIEETMAAIVQRCKQQANQAEIAAAVAAERAWFVQVLREWDSTAEVESVLRIRLSGA